MSRKIIYNIGKLAGILPAEVRKLEGKDMGHVECIDNACLIIENGIIKEFGTVVPEDETDAEYIDAKGGYVMPCFCDSHTHIVYAGCRDGEFRDKIAGLSYEEIAARGGGIFTRSRKLRLL